MEPVLEILLEILRILRFSRDCIKRFPGRGASLLALLGRKLTAWWRFWRRKLGSHGGRKKVVKRPFVGTESGGSAVVGGYVIAASSVPPSASHPSLHERTDGQHQLATVVYPASTGTHHWQAPPVIDTLSVDHPYGHNPTQPLGTRGLVNRSTGNLSATSIQSRGSDRLSIRTTSYDSIRATHGRPSRLPSPRAPYRQFGRSPDPSRSRERLTRPNSRPNTPSTRPHTPSTRPHTPSTRPHTPSTRPHTPLDPSHLEITTTNLPFVAHGNSRASPFVPPSGSSAYTHQPLSPPTSNEVRRGQTSTKFVVKVQNPSTESLPSTPLTTNPITDESLTMESATAYSSPGSLVVNQHDEPIPGSTTPSNVAALDHNLPEFQVLPASVQPINSEDIPRYTKYALMQVEYTILSPHPHISLQTTRGDTL
jgi:hypothetical protein